MYTKMRLYTVSVYATLQAFSLCQPTGYRVFVTLEEAERYAAECQEPVYDITY